MINITRRFHDAVLKVAKGSGGGGSGVTVEPLSVTENGTYQEEGKAYSPVKVNTPELVTVTLTIKNERSDDPLYVSPGGCALFATDGTNIMVEGGLTVPPLSKGTIECVLVIGEDEEHGYINALTLVGGAMVNVALDNTVNCYLDVSTIIIDDPTKPSSCEIIYSPI